jgi:murein DD-endopeptidase MepM/ murein hydrolase activator NlpD
LLTGLLAGPLEAVPATRDPIGEWPLRPPPEVVTAFDPPETTWGPGHRGVDLSGAPGQRVHAALPGTISFVGSIAGRGVVVVDHGRTRTTYEPVGAAVQQGQRVSAGEVIGSLGLPGSHCFPRSCLHWGWLLGDTYLDPLRLVGGGPVRLLPLDGVVALGPAPPAAAPPSTSPYAGWSPPVDALRLWP